MIEPRRYATVEELTEPGQLGEEDVQTTSGRWMRVRALTRAEAAKLQDIDGTAAGECYALSRGIVEPRMNEPQVRAMMDANRAGELNPVSVKIMEMSGLVEGAEKKAVRDFETGEVDEFRVLPDTETRARNGREPTPDHEQS